MSSCLFKNVTIRCVYESYISKIDIETGFGIKPNQTKPNQTKSFTSFIAQSAGAVKYTDWFSAGE